MHRSHWPLFSHLGVRHAEVAALLELAFVARVADAGVRRVHLADRRIQPIGDGCGVRRRLSVFHLLGIHRQALIPHPRPDPNVLRLQETPIASRGKYSSPANSLTKKTN